MEKHYGWGFPVNISAHGAGIDNLINVTHLFMLVLFVGWSAFIIYALIRFSKKNNPKADYHAKHFSIPKYIEVFIAVVEVILLCGFSIPMLHYINDKLPSMKNAMPIRVVAEQFAWNIRYPGSDGVFNTADDVETINLMHVPVHRPVAVTLRSKDVIHSFFLPLLRIKQDVVPGMPTRTWFEATRTGQLEIVCAELCGLGHYRMRGFLTIETEAEWRAWLVKTKAEQ